MTFEGPRTVFAERFFARLSSTCRFPQGAGFGLRPRTCSLLGLLSCVVRLTLFLVYPMMLGAAALSRTRLEIMRRLWRSLPRSSAVAAVVVMPTTASSIKVTGARRHGAEVLFEGTTSLARKARAEREADERGLQMIPPFDHPQIIAGQGTVGAEILENMPTIMRIYVPVGGGGLIAGVSAAVKAANPGIRVIGVEPVGASKMKSSLAVGHPVTLDSVSSVADGLLPVRPGDLTFAHARAFVDEIVTVDDAAIERAVVWLIRNAKLVVEPSGAATVAACLGRPDEDSLPEAAVVSGGNIGPDALVDIMTRIG